MKGPSPFSGVPPTERPNPESVNLGSSTPREVFAMMSRVDSRMLRAVDAASEPLTALAFRVADAYRARRRTIFLGAGTSGRLVHQEVAELPPTFGVSPDAFLALVATRAPLGPSAVAATEDDENAVVQALDALRVGAGDVVIGVAASGKTPFVVAGLAHARTSGAWTAGIVNNPDSAVGRAADLEIYLDTGPEILTGSTRLAAGSSQKLALNRITTAAMVDCGLVEGNHMTAMMPTTSKLRDRAVRIMCELRSVSPTTAQAVLEDAHWDLRAALQGATECRQPQTPLAEVRGDAVDEPLG